MKHAIRRPQFGIVDERDAARTESTVKDRDAALAKGEVLDAVLANAAIMIMSGDGAGPTAWTAQHCDTIHGDEAARSLAANLNPKDQAGAQTALKVLTELRKQPGNAMYMLDVFEGNTQLALRQGQAGADHLLAALKVNPYLLGAWKDLGGFYYGSYETDKAWACWDEARRVNAQHSMLVQITELENWLRKAFPEFF
jgi:hypothetical protein